jgi:WD40 repeat protein
MIKFLPFFIGWLIVVVLLSQCQSRPKPTEITTAAPASVKKEVSIQLDTLWVRMGDGDGQRDQKMPHPTSVEKAEFSPDETLFATVAKGDASVRLWRINGDTVWTKFAEAETEAVTFTRDGQYLITGGEDMKIRAWRVEDGEVVRTLNDVASIEGLRKSSDGQRLASGNEAGQIKLWDISAADPQEWPDQPLHTLVHAPDQHAPGGKPGAGDADINQLDWTEDDRYLVSGSRNQEVKLWSVAPDSVPSLVRTFAGFTGSIKAARLSPGDSLLAAGAQSSPDGSVRVWRTQTGELVNTLQFPNLRIVETVEFTPNGQFLLVGGTEKDSLDNGHLYAFSVAKLRRKGFVPPSKDIRVFDQEYLYFNQKGSRLLSSHADGSVRLWKISY